MMLLPPDPQQGCVGTVGGVGCRQHVVGVTGVEHAHPAAMAATGRLRASKVKLAAIAQRHSKRLFMVGRLHGHAQFHPPLPERGAALWPDSSLLDGKGRPECPIPTHND
jgi:hypothetical protein